MGALPQRRPLIDPRWAASVLKSRGVGFSSPQALTRLCAECSTEQAAEIRADLLALGSGADAAVGERLIQMLRCVGDAAQAAYESAGCSPTVPDTLAALDRHGRVFLQALAAVVNGTAEASTARPRLASMLKPLGTTPLAQMSDDIDHAPVRAPAPSTGSPSGEALPTAKQTATVHSLARTKPVAQGVEGQGAEPESLLPQASQRASRHIYGSKAALSFELSTLRKVDSRTGEPTHTLLLETAKSTGPKQFAWDQKISFQLTERELPLFAAVLLGKLHACSFANHGDENNKSLDLENQQAKLFLKLRQGKNAHALPIPAEELLPLLSASMLAISRNHPHLSSILPTVIDRCATLYAANQAPD